jgi:hypothetical protein
MGEDWEDIIIDLDKLEVVRPGSRATLTELVNEADSSSARAVAENPYAGT